MNTLTIMVGIPCTGKSTVANDIDGILISSDDLRVKLFGFEDQTHNKELFSIMNILTSTYGKEEKNVIYDATNLSRKRRVALAKEMTKYFSNINIVTTVCSIEEIFYRNSTRKDRYIPEDKLKEMIKSFEPPTCFEFPYNKIEYITTSNKKDKIILDIDKLDDYSQHNKNHSENLGNHIKRVMKHCQDNEIAYEAALYHDIGKPFCKQIDKEGYYHFYSHNKVGTLIYLNDLLIEGRNISEKEIFVLLLIEMHDFIFNFKNINEMKEHYIKKGYPTSELFWNSMRLLIEGDRLRP